MNTRNLQKKQLEGKYELVGFWNPWFRFCRLSDFVHPAASAVENEIVNLEFYFVEADKVYN